MDSFSFVLTAVYITWPLMLYFVTRSDCSTQPSDSFYGIRTLDAYPEGKLGSMEARRVILRDA